jgi:hypothetical protein
MSGGFLGKIRFGLSVGGWDLENCIQLGRKLMNLKMVLGEVRFGQVVSRGGKPVFGLRIWSHFLNFRP